MDGKITKPSEAKWSWADVYKTVSSNKPKKQDFDHDPMRDIVAEELVGADLEVIHENTGVSVTTMRNWMTKKTKRPQHMTMAFVLKGLGKHFAIVDDQPEDAIVDDPPKDVS